METLKNITQRVQAAQTSIVFPEGSDLRILGAALDLDEENILTPILLGNKEEIKKAGQELNRSVDHLITIDPKDYDDIDYLAQALVERRGGKLSLDEAYKTLENPNYFGTMLVYLDRVDGMVSGAVGTTANTVRPALQIIKTKPGVAKTSGLFLVLGDRELLMADCAINIETKAEDLAEIAYLTDETGRKFGFDPKIAFLSFSTKGSAKSDEVTKVSEAVEIAKEKYKDITVDGELQFDAAISPVVAKRKAPNSPVAGQANTFIFPNLASGNIGYKIASYLGGYQAIGPILQGLNKPVNDLSRGSTKEDIYYLAIITAAQRAL